MTLEPLAALTDVLQSVPDWAHSVTLCTFSTRFHEQLLAEPDSTGMDFDYFTDTPTILGIPFQVDTTQAENAILWGSGGRRLA